MSIVVPANSSRIADGYQSRPTVLRHNSPGPISPSAQTAWESVYYINDVMPGRFHDFGVGGAKVTKYSQKDDNLAVEISNKRTLLEQPTFPFCNTVCPAAKAPSVADLAAKPASPAILLPPVANSAAFPASVAITNSTK